MTDDSLQRQADNVKNSLQYAKFPMHVNCLAWVMDLSGTLYNDNQQPKAPLSKAHYPCVLDVSSAVITCIVILIESEKEKVSSCVALAIHVHATQRQDVNLRRAVVGKISVNQRVRGEVQCDFGR